MGWWKDTSGNRYNFYEVDDADTNNQPVNKTWAANGMTTSPEYKITYSANYFHFFIDGNNWYNFSSPTYSGCDAAQAEETHNKASQMPGIVSRHETIHNTEIRNTSGWNANYGGWEPYWDEGADWEGQSWNNAVTNLDLWDTACP